MKATFVSSICTYCLLSLFTLTVIYLLKINVVTATTDYLNMTTYYQAHHIQVADHPVAYTQNVIAREDFQYDQLYAEELKKITFNH